VLESIFPEELERTTDRSIRIRVEPEEPSSSRPLTVHLVVTYPPTYPDDIPDLALEAIDEESGELDEEERQEVLSQLRAVAEESVGMAMTFTIASAAREVLGEVIKARLKREKEEDDRRTREYEEAEAKRTRGTPLTPTTFSLWRQRFVRELKEKRDREEEERVKAMAPKDREDWRRRRERLTGKQLFETSAILVNSDEGLYDDGTAVDISQYSREERERERRQEEEEEERRRRGLVEDSDGE